LAISERLPHLKVLWLPKVHFSQTNVFTKNPADCKYAKHIYEYKNWTDFTWRETDINAIFGEVLNLQVNIVRQNT
jgi:hypothetical protein